MNYTDRSLFWTFCTLWISCSLWAQTDKRVVQNEQLWVGVHGQYWWNEHWGVMADLHHRRFEFSEIPGVYVARAALSYRLRGSSTLAAGGALFFNPPSAGTEVLERRLYQQWIWSQAAGKLQVGYRIRNEQRWQERRPADAAPSVRFTNRTRFLLSLTVPVFRNSKLPKLLVYDEILMHMGPEVVYNPMDQNRIYAGFRQKIDAQWSFDLGYLGIYQQSFSGSDYVQTHVLRLFIYFESVPTPNIP